MLVPCLVSYAPVFQLCTVLFDWTDDANAKDNKAKEVKRHQLLELVEYISKNKGIFTDAVLSELMNMVRTLASFVHAFVPHQKQSATQCNRRNVVNGLSR